MNVLQKTKSAVINSNGYGLRPLLLDCSCLANKIQSLSPLINKLDWINENDALFRVYWNYLASGCEERLFNIRRQIEQNADLMQQTKDKKAASFLNLLIHHKQRTLNKIAESNLSPESAANAIYEEFVDCFRRQLTSSTVRPLTSSTVKRRKRCRPQLQLTAWKSQVDDSLYALKKTMNPYEIEQINQKLSRLKELQSQHQPSPLFHRMLKTKLYKYYSKKVFDEEPAEDTDRIDEKLRSSFAKNHVQYLKKSTKPTEEKSKTLDKVYHHGKRYSNKRSDSSTNELDTENHIEITPQNKDKDLHKLAKKEQPTKLKNTFTSKPREDFFQDKIKGINSDGKQHPYKTQSDKVGENLRSPQRKRNHKVSVIQENDTNFKESKSPYSFHKNSYDKSQKGRKTHWKIAEKNKNTKGDKVKVRKKHKLSLKADKYILSPQRESKEKPSSIITSDGLKKEETLSVNSNLEIQKKVNNFRGSKSPLNFGKRSYKKINKSRKHSIVFTPKESLIGKQKVHLNTMYSLRRNVVYNNPYVRRKQSNSSVKLVKNPDPKNPNRVERSSSFMSIASNKELYFSHKPKYETTQFVKNSRLTGSSNSNTLELVDKEEDEDEPQLELSDMVMELMKSKGMYQFFSHLFPEEVKDTTQDSQQQETPKAKKPKSKRKLQTEDTGDTLAPKICTPCEICDQLKQFAASIQQPSYMQQMQRQNKVLELRFYYKQMILLEEQRQEQKRHEKESLMCPL